MFLRFFLERCDCLVVIEAAGSVGTFRCADLLLFRHLVTQL